jgi:hypothetical protein
VFLCAGKFSSFFTRIKFSRARPHDLYVRKTAHVLRRKQRGTTFGVKATPPKRVRSVQNLDSKLGARISGIGGVKRIVRAQFEIKRSYASPCSIVRGARTIRVPRTGRNPENRCIGNRMALPRVQEGQKNRTPARARTIVRDSHHCPGRACCAQERGRRSR